MSQVTILDTYPLSPMQQGMLFHHLQEPHSGVDIEQLIVHLPEAVDVRRLEAAWQWLVDRHAILRTQFSWEGLEQPCQEILATVKVPFTVPNAGQLNAFLETDRRQGFELNSAPLLRLTLFRWDVASYSLVWTFHHALLDGRCFPILLREVFEAYAELEQGKIAVRPAPPPYRRYIDWLPTQNFTAAESFWKNLLQGFTAPTPLVVDRHVPPAAGVVPQGEAWGMLNAATARQLRHRATEQGLSVNTLVMSAWAILLHRYSNEEDLVFGATRACRKSSVPDADETLGLFINTVPVRVKLTGAMPVADVCREVRRQWVAMRDHEQLPLARIKAVSQITAGQPLFESLVVFENSDLETTLRSLGGSWTNRRVELHELTSVPVTLCAYHADDLKLKLEFDRRRIEDAAIQRMLGHLQRLLEQIAGGAGSAVDDLLLLTEAERRQQVVEWNATTMDYPVALLHELFEAQVQKTPDSVALEFAGHCLTYRELDRRANQLAHYLRGLGVKPDQLVGVCSERSLEMVVALYGILKAGGAYVPIDPEYPADRVAFMLADAGVSVLLTQQHLVASLLAHSARVVCLDADWQTISQENATKPRDEITAANLAYMIYTSGSTGKPKGALNAHRGIVNRLLWMQAQYQIGATDVVLQKTPFSFDVSVWEFFWPLQTGARLVIAKPGGHKDAAYLSELIQTHRVTTVHFVPSMLRVFLDEPSVALCRTLRYVICSGEALPADLQEKYFARLAAQLHNLYGPTEAAVDVTYWTCRRDDELGCVPIGRPVANTQCYILDTRLRPTPLGVSGELHLGGVQVGRGYHNRPALTAEKFIPDIFQADPSARLYKTGDLCRYLPDGNIEYLGRLDHQVKIRGFRIELGEIEARLAELPAVKESVVVARQDDGEKRLVAYLIAQQQPPPGFTELRDHLLKSLPDFMVPAAFVWLAAMPLSPNGKVDRKALPAPTGHRPAAAGYVAPRNVAEQILSGAWAAVLRLDRVGVTDNFFELGGDSILMIQIIARARQSGLTLTPKLIFQYPTIAGLATAIPAVSVVPAEQGLVTGEVQLTPVQQWFFEQDLAEPQHWNQAFLLRTSERLDAGLLAQAVEQVERHHDALRLRFNRENGVWRQTHGAPGSVSGRTTFDLATGPLLRVVESAPGRLLIAIHHLVVDGISWRILLEDLETVYSQLRAGAAVQLPPKTTSFQRWSRALTEHAGTAAVRGELTFWRDVPASHLPGNAGGENTEGAARTVTVALEASETQRLLQRLPAVFKTQINDALLTAVAQAVARWTGQSGLTVDLEGHGREDIAEGLDVSRTVGWFTTIFPVHLDVGPDLPPVAALKRVKEQLRAVPRRGIGYGLLRYLAGETELKLQPEIIFNYFGQFDQVLAGSKLFQFAPESAGPWRSPAARRRYELEINAVVTGGRLEVAWTYAPARQAAATVQRVADDFLAALRQIILASESASASALVPTDFPLAALDQTGLEQLVETVGPVEDIFPLSPVQGLFHALESAGNSVGFDQYHFKLRGALDVAAFRCGWEQVLARHAVLRTRFVAEGLKAPLQVVLAGVELPWIEADWRNIPPTERAAKFAEFLAADRARGFDLARPPLMRCSLIRIGEVEWWFVWSHHHLQIDGWSWPLLLKEVAGSVAAQPRPFSDYIGWLKDRCVAQDETFWREQLRGFTEPTPVPQKNTPSATGGFAEATLRLEAEAIQQLARGRQMPLNTLVQAAWAAVLSRQSGRSDVLFGAAFSGRPHELPGVETMVGSFVNNVPVRARVPVERSVGDWLGDLQAGQVLLSQHQFASPVQVQEWSEVPWRYRLFESLVVFQNYVVEEGTWRFGAAAIQDFVAPIRTNFPLTLVVVPGAELTLTLVYDTRRIDAKLAGDVLQDMATALRELPVKLQQPVGELLAGLRPPVARATSRPVKLRGSSQNYLAPQSELEKSIATIWQQAFGIDRVGTLDNFFDLGGHSLLMIQVHSRLCQALAKDISIVRMFQYPTIGALAKFLGQSAGGTSLATVQDRAQLQRAALARQRPAMNRKL